MIQRREKRHYMTITKAIATFVQNVTKYNLFNDV